MKKIYLVFICLLIAMSVSAQKSNAKRKRPGNFNKPNNDTNQFLEKQWWLGFKAGANLSSVAVGKKYTVYSSLDGNPNVTDKKYQNLKKLGTQIGLELTFTFQRLSLGIQPTYRHAIFSYTNDYAWIGAGANDNLTSHYKQEQKVDHIELPVVAKYEFGRGKLRPYLQLGGYAAFLVNATKSVTVTDVDNASGRPNEIERAPIIVGAKDLFAKNHWGMIAGAGVNYHVGNVRFNLDVMYKYCMSNVTATKSRYSNNQVSGAGDAMDNLKLNNLAFSLGCLFPLRFLENGFKSLDKNL
jgi:outer membrane protein W